MWLKLYGLVSFEHWMQLSVNNTTSKLEVILKHKRFIRHGLAETNLTTPLLATA